MLVGCEFLLSHRLSHYATALFFVPIILFVFLLFWREFDLFASIVLAIYSSVLLFLSLFLVYFNRYWGRSNFELSGDTGGVFELAVLAVAAWVSQFFFLDNVITAGGELALSGHWASHLMGYDLYLVASLGESISANLMHAMLYKAYVLEVFFLNVFLLFGLVLTVAVISLSKLAINNNLVERSTALWRVNFTFFFPENFRVRAVSKLRRQLRRKNSSTIKYK